MNWSLIILNGTLVALSLTVLGYLLSREEKSHEGFGALSWLLALAAIIQVTTVSDWTDNWQYIVAGAALAFVWGFARVTYEFKEKVSESALKKIAQDHFQYNQNIYAYVLGLKSKADLLKASVIGSNEDESYTEQRIRQQFFNCLNQIASVYKKRNDTSCVVLEVNPEAYSLLDKPGADQVELFKARIDTDTVIGTSFMYGLAAPFSIVNLTVGKVLRYLIIDVLYTKYLQEIQKISQKWFKDLFKF